MKNNPCTVIVLVPNCNCHQNGARFLQVMVDNYNRDVADDPFDKTFQMGFVDVDSSTGMLYWYLMYEKIFESIKDKLLDRLGGELHVRKEDGCE